MSNETLHPAELTDGLRRCIRASPLIKRGAEGRKLQRRTSESPAYWGHDGEPCAGFRDVESKVRPLRKVCPTVT